jgi:hypothetical protein
MYSSCFVSHIGRLFTTVLYHTPGKLIVLHTPEILEVQSDFAIVETTYF